ncbi:LysR family transcriptional regulator [Herbaspirillum sp. RTI4]|uniref:LysR family transcriptional regulator n=1 Tax=Herbaspirillum sp. RTI4 TaxID=3048640 RepID=UPI002AB487BC|nr:LysR family transcriptional regulator [Herbaspirillum sp. RTI4]MDY7578392.1 LysR family transcriptional regulator [Herbaspirillum sp. RTI4]MEA9983067.1 LysR family transcriptional regulator [Herbaspirillum sp. RTI4]
MDTLQNMRIFMRVVDAGSFTLAAQQMELTTAHVSRALADLERHLRTRLLNRTTRRLAMTEAGERYLLRCQQIISYVEEAEAEAGDAYVRPSGRLRIHSMTSFGQRYVIPVISSYQKRYPDVAIELTLAQRVPDLLEEGFDVSLVLARELLDSGLIFRQIGSIYSILCASPFYLEKHGSPERPVDLLAHSCLQLVSPVSPLNEWTLEGPGGKEVVAIKSNFHVNVAEAMLLGIKEGMGIGVLPIYSAVDALRAGTIVRVLPPYRMQNMGVFALYPSRQYLDAKISTWVDWMHESVGKALLEDHQVLERFGI